jgi:hypothetical protein
MGLLDTLLLAHTVVAPEEDYLSIFTKMLTNESLCTNSSSLAC